MIFLFIVHSVTQLQEALHANAQEIILTGNVVNEIKDSLLKNNYNLIENKRTQDVIRKISDYCDFDLIVKNDYSCVIVTTKQNQIAAVSF